VAARNADRAAAARNEILAEVPRADVRIRALDLASLASVDRCADEILAETDVVDILVNNAGVMAVPRGLTEDGFERQLGVNHLGHFVLTARLLPAVLRAGEGRIVHLTSSARFLGGMVDPDDPNLEHDYEPWRAYGRSKLATLQFGLELSRRLVGTGVRSTAADPGFSNTDLQANAARETGGLGQRLSRVLVNAVGTSPARGALPQLRAATDPRAASGTVFAPLFVLGGPPARAMVTGPHTAVDDLELVWTLSERLTGVELDVDGAIDAARHS
jgi:NAD(P)-dependent dehydrogenase (short-subunit alcohol dehydrogenase family)